MFTFLEAEATLRRSVLIPLVRTAELFRPVRAQSEAARTAGMMFRVSAEHWTDAERHSFLLRRLRTVLRHAQRHTPYYKHLFSSIGFDAEADFEFSDFARVPVLERESALQNETDLVARNIERSRLTLDSTGGSTGKPVHVWLGPAETGWRDSGAEYFRRRIGVVPGRRTALLWGHNLDPNARNSLRDRATALVRNYRWFDCFRLSPEVLESYHQELQRWKPDYLVAYASALASLAAHVIDQGHRPAYPREFSITGAEKLFPKQRELVERAFGEVHEQYGSRDIGLIAFQLSGKSRDFSVDWANLLVEPETTDLNSPVLVTKLNADGSMIIRYRVGDVARFPNGSKPGHPVFGLSEIIGRVTDRIYLPSGQWIAGTQLPHLLKAYPVREFMLLQHPDYSVDLQIVPDPLFGDSDGEAIRSTISANLPGILLRIALVKQVERMQANKLRPVVSEVDVLKAYGHER